MALFRLVIVILTICFLPWQAVHSRSASAGSKYEQAPVSVRLYADTNNIESGKPFKLSFQFEMLPGWHIYYKNPGDAGIPTQVKLNLPEGFIAGPTKWSPPQTFTESGIVTYGYSKKAILSTVIIPPGHVKAGDAIHLSASIKWLACNKVCLPGGTTVAISLPTVPVQNENLVLYLCFAFVGGAILNLMPCVLPVIAIKVMGLLTESSNSKGRTQLLGAAFASGIILSFVSLGGILIALKMAGHQVGWGFQFQYPGFVVAMAAIVTLMALSLFGLFYISVPAHTSSLNGLAQQEGIAGTFFKGVLATVLSTPCTAPFLGTALGFAFTQPWWIVLTIFVFIGLGMSLPYLLLIVHPGALRYLPKPGIWMEKVKESTAFLLLGTVVWLLHVLGAQVGTPAVVDTIAFLISLSFCAWILSRFTSLSTGTHRTIGVWSIIIALGALSYYLFIGSHLEDFSPHAATARRIPSVLKIGSKQGHGKTIVQASAMTSRDLIWQEYNPDLLAQYLEKGTPVLLDFTAAWCLTCQVNERTVLSSRTVIDKLQSLHVVTMRADWTSQNAEITSLLHKFHRSGVPLYVIFPPHRPNYPIVLPEILTESVLLEKLDQCLAQPQVGSLITRGVHLLSILS